MTGEEETIAVRTGEGLDLERVERYLRTHIKGKRIGQIEQKERRNHGS